MFHDSLSSSKSDDQIIEKESENESESNTIDGPNPYEEFNNIFINDRFLKSSTIFQFVKLLNEPVLDKLLAINDREDFVKYVEAIYRHLRLNPQKFIFFMTKPEPSEKEEKEMILIRSDRKILCIRRNSFYMLKGHVAHIFFKNKSRIQITMSKGLFMKLTVWKELKNLKQVIPDFLNLTENPQFHTVEELFFKSLMDLPNKLSHLNHILKNSFLSLLLTANLEFCRKLAFTDFKEDNIFKVSQDIMFIFIKSHLWDHLMRTLIPLYIEKQVESVETVMVDYNICLIPCLLKTCRAYFGNKFLQQVRKVLYPIVCQKDFNEYAVLAFVQLVLNMNFPSQILLIAKELYKAVKAKFPDDEYAAPFVIGSFLITDFIFPEILKRVDEKEEKNRYLIFLNVLTFNNDFKEGIHFFNIIRKLYISLGEGEISSTRLLNTEKKVFDKHVSHLFSYFQENSSYLYNQFITIDLSKEKTPVYCEIMELFECIESVKSGEQFEKYENYEEQLILELNQVHVKLKKGKIRIKRTDKKEIKQILKKQEQDRKKIFADIKEKKDEKKKQAKIERKNEKKLEKKKKKKDESVNDNDDNDSKSDVNEAKNDEDVEDGTKGDDDDKIKIEDDIKIENEYNDVEDEFNFEDEIKSEHDEVETLGEIRDDEVKVVVDDGFKAADDASLNVDGEIKADDGESKEADDTIMHDDEVKKADDTIMHDDEVKVDDDASLNVDGEIKADDGEFKEADDTIMHDDGFKADDDSLNVDGEIKADDGEFKEADDTIMHDDEIKVDDDGFKADDDSLNVDGEIIKADDTIMHDDDEIKVDADDGEFIEADGTKAEGEIKGDASSLGVETKDEFDAAADSVHKAEDDVKHDDRPTVGGSDLVIGDDVKTEDDKLVDGGEIKADGDVKTDIDEKSVAYDPSLLRADIDHVPEDGVSLGIEADPDAEIKTDLVIGDETGKEAGDADISAKADTEQPEIEDAKTKTKGKSKEKAKPGKDKSQKKKFSFFKSQKKKG